MGGGGGGMVLPLKLSSRAAERPPRLPIFLGFLYCKNQRRQRLNELTSDNQEEEMCGANNVRRPCNMITGSACQLQSSRDLPGIFALAVRGIFFEYDGQPKKPYVEDVRKMAVGLLHSTNSSTVFQQAG